MQVDPAQFHFLFLMYICNKPKLAVLAYVKSTAMLSNEGYYIYAMATGLMVKIFVFEGKKNHPERNAIACSNRLIRENIWKDVDGAH